MNAHVGGDCSVGERAYLTFALPKDLLSASSGTRLRQLRRRHSKLMCSAAMLVLNYHLPGIRSRSGLTQAYNLYSTTKYRPLSRVICLFCAVYLASPSTICYSIYYLYSNSELTFCQAQSATACQTRLTPAAQLMRLLLILRAGRGDPIGQPTPASSRCAGADKRHGCRPLLLCHVSGERAALRCTLSRNQPRAGA